MWRTIRLLRVRRSTSTTTTLVRHEMTVLSEIGTGASLTEVGLVSRRDRVWSDYFSLGRGLGLRLGLELDCDFGFDFNCDFSFNLDFARTIGFIVIPTFAINFTLNLSNLFRWPAHKLVVRRSVLRLEFFDMEARVRWQKKPRVSSKVDDAVVVL